VFVVVSESVPRRAGRRREDEMAAGRWYLVAILFAILFQHAYGWSWKLAIALLACLSIWVRTVMDEWRASRKVDVEIIDTEREQRGERG
jgi:membrane protein implicated in regulation of membrane protease activity